MTIQKDKEKLFPKEVSVKEALRGGKPEGEIEEQPEGEIEEQPDPERGLPPAYDDVAVEGRSIEEGPKKDEQKVNPSLAKTDRDPLSEPNSTQVSLSNGFPGKIERPSVREKLNLYKAEIAKEKAELAKDVVSKGIEAVSEAAKAVSIPKVPGRDR